jgi:alpha-tubulin suppressor-like RCC1 family protein
MSRAGISARRRLIGSGIAVGAALLSGLSATACFSNSSSGQSPDAGFMENPDVTIADSGETPETSGQDSTTADSGFIDSATHDAGASDGPGGDTSIAVDSGVADASTHDGANGDGGPQPLSGVVGIAMSGQTPSLSYTAICAWLSDGSARCWGADGYGLTGNGTPQSPFVTVYATEPTGLASGVTAVAVGDDHACALQSGSTLCWGQDLYDLPDGGTGGAYVPTDIPAFAGATAIATGGEVTCAILGGTVSCLGANPTGNVGNGTNATAYTPFATGVSATHITVGDTTCALTPAGGIDCWGRDDYGQAGRAATDTCVTVACDETPGLTSITSGATSVVVGAYHTCAIVNGAAECWGDDRSGQLGNGTTNAGVNSSPVAVQGLAAAPLQLALSWQATCALEQGGIVQCWGDNTSGALGVLDAGTGSLAPVTVLTGATAIAGGDYTFCALMSDTTVQCWGNDQQGELGAGTFDANAHGPTTVMVP